MRHLHPVILLFFLTLGALASPWDSAEKAPADARWVVAWDLSEEELRPFWELALELDLEVVEEGAPTMQSIVEATGMSLEQLTDSFDGTGSVWCSQDGKSYALTLGLNSRSGVYEEFAKMWHDLGRIQPGLFEVSCQPDELQVRFGLGPLSKAFLKGDGPFQEARASLQQPASLVLFRSESPAWRFAAVSIDLESETSLGVLAFRGPLKLQSQSEVKESVLTHRPKDLQTILALDPQGLSMVLNELGDALPSRLRPMSQFLQASSSGDFLQLVRSPGLLGVNSNPLAMFLGASSGPTLYARARYRDLSGLEDFLADLERKARLRTLKSCQDNLNHLIFLVRRYEVDFKQPTPENFEPLIPTLLDRVPDCPAAGRPTYAIDASPEGSSVYCRGDHHPQTPPNFPRFDTSVGMMDGEQRELPKLVDFSRLDPGGQASYRLVSGQRIEVDRKRETVSLSDGEFDRDYLREGREAIELPDLMKENFEWSEGRLLYLDYFDISTTAGQLQSLVSTNRSDRPTQLLVKAFLTGLDRGETLQGSQVLRWDDDSIKYRGRGLWSAPVLLSTLTATPLWARSQRRERKREIARQCRGNLQVLADALNQYRVHRGTFPEKLADLVPAYLEAIPPCPVAKKDTYSKSYYWEDRHYGGNFPDRLILEMCCLGHHHSAAGWEENHPRFDLDDGLFPKGD